MDTLLSMKKASALLGVHPQTLRAWDRSGVLVPVRMPSGRRRYRLSDLEALIGRDSDAGRTCGIYARVSTKKQEEMGNLARQQERLVAYATANGYKVGLSASDALLRVSTLSAGAWPS